MSVVPDVTFHVPPNGGAVFLLRPRTDAAHEWIAEYVPEPVWFGPSLAVEHRYVEDLILGMREDGLVVTRGEDTR
jgi:hypothetical protein